MGSGLGILLQDDLTSISISIKSNGGAYQEVPS